MIMAKGPKFSHHFVPLLESLRGMGGSAAAYEAIDAVIERENIQEKELAKTNKREPRVTDTFRSSTSAANLGASSTS